jgi:hypothetical protein
MLLAVAIPVQLDALDLLERHGPRSGPDEHVGRYGCGAGRTIEDACPVVQERDPQLDYEPGVRLIEDLHRSLPVRGMTSPKQGTRTASRRNIRGVAIRMKNAG